MRIYRAKDYYDMSRKAANIISAQVIMKPDCVLGLATGSTPIGTYAQLVEWYKKGDLDFSEVKTVNLDEYKGLDSRTTRVIFTSWRNICLTRSILIFRMSISQMEWKRMRTRNVRAMRRR